MNPYFEQMVLGASPIELVRLLFQRAIRSVREAREHLAAGRIAERSNAVTNAWEILAELMSSLNDDVAPELSNRLRALYCYMQERLLHANLKREDAPMAEVLGLLTTLSEAWQAPLEPAARPHPSTPAWMTADAGAEADRLAFTA